MVGFLRVLCPVVRCEAETWAGGCFESAGKNEGRNNYILYQPVRLKRVVRRISCAWRGGSSSQCHARLCTCGVPSFRWVGFGVDA